MVKLRKLLAIILSSAMTMSLLAGCGSTESGTSSQTPESSSAQQESTSQADASSQETTPEVQEPVEVTYPIDSDVDLKVYIYRAFTLSSAYTEHGDTPFLKGLVERTGVNATFESAPVGGDRDASYNLMLQEEELPDIIMGKISPDKVSQYLEDGLLRDISEYLPIYAPDYWEWINSDDEMVSRVRKINTVDGKIMNFVGARDVPDNNSWAGILVRKDWLDALGLEIPDTFEEFDNMARAFHDEYGAVITGVSSCINNTGIVAGALGAFAGLDMRWYVEDGEVKLANVDEEWKEFLTVMNQWYDEGILDPNITAATLETNRQMAIEGKTGILIQSSGNAENFFHKEAVAQNTGAEWIGIEPIGESEGEPAKFAHADYSTFMGVGCWVTKDCTDEELIAALQFLNYGYTEEGMMYWNFGEEGLTYELDANGEPYFTDLILGDERGTAPARRDYTGCQDSPPASIQMYKTVEAATPGGVFDQCTQAWKGNNDYHNYAVPPLTYLSEEQKVYDDLSGAISTYISEMALKFMVGEESLDNFDSFVETLNSMGLEQLTEIQNAAYQRFLAK